MSIVSSMSAPHHCISVLRKLDDRKVAVVMSNLSNTSSPMQTWHFFISALLAPTWLCGEVERARKQQLITVLLSNQSFVYGVLQQYALNINWAESSVDQRELVDSFAALAIFSEISSHELAEDINVFLNYTLAIFNSRPTDFYRATQHANTLIDDLGIDFGFVAEFLERISENENRQSSEAISEADRSKMLASWLCNIKLDSSTNDEG